MKRFGFFTVAAAIVLCVAGLPGGLARCAPEPSDPEGGVREEGTLDKVVENFWQSDTMYDETVLFIAETDGEGNVLSAPQAKLLFPAEKIIEIKQYRTDSDDPVLFAEGEDCTCDADTLTAVGTLREDAGKMVFSGSVPYVTDKSLTGEMPFPGVPYSKTVSSKQTPGLYLPFTEGTGIVAMQCSVAYTHSGK